MLITDLMAARGYAPTQREAVRILHSIIAGLDVRPMPDGTVKFNFTGDVDMLDRIAMWGAADEDFEDDGTGEDDARRLGRATDDPDVIDIGAERAARAA